MKRWVGYGLVSASVTFGGMWVAGQVELHTFEAGDLIRSDEVNANFAALSAAMSNVVGSINGKFGAVTIEGGQNVTVDDSQDGTIVISATTGAGGSGDITGVMAGSGLRGGGASGTVTLSVSDDVVLESEVAARMLEADGPGSGLDADTLDGLDSTAFTQADDIMPTVLDHDGPGSGLDADTLDGLDSTAFTQADDIMPTVLDHDGPGSGLDADSLDGLESTDFVPATSPFLPVAGGTFYYNFAGSMLVLPHNTGNFTVHREDIGVYVVEIFNSSFDACSGDVALVTPVASDRQRAVASCYSGGRDHIGTFGVFITDEQGTPVDGFASFVAFDFPAVPAP